MSGYPEGAANDPSAPWNQREDEVCPYCDGQDEDCSTCDGTGYLSGDQYEQWLEDEKFSKNEE